MTGTFAGHCSVCRLWHVVYPSGRVTNEPHRPFAALHAVLDRDDFLARLRRLRACGVVVKICRSGE